jgi:hypothetical protein
MLKLRSRWLLAPLAGALLLVAAPSGCERNKFNGPNDPNLVGMGLPETQSGPTRPKMEQECELSETIKAPEEGSPEALIKNLLEAASSPEDDEASFEKFYAQFPASKNRSEVKSLYWPRARTHAKKYLVAGEEGVVFMVCRRVDQPKGGVKLFIKSFDEDKSNPPIGFAKDESGKYKVSVYTP